MNQSDIELEVIRTERDNEERESTLSESTTIAPVPAPLHFLETAESRRRLQSLTIPFSRDFWFLDFKSTANLALSYANLANVEEKKKSLETMYENNPIAWDIVHEYMTGRDPYTVYLEKLILAIRTHERKIKQRFNGIISWYKFTSKVRNRNVKYERFIRRNYSPSGFGWTVYFMVYFMIFVTPHFTGR